MKKQVKVKKQAEIIKCGDCGKKMTKTTWNNIRCPKCRKNREMARWGHGISEEENEGSLEYLLKYYDIDDMPGFRD